MQVVLDAARLPEGGNYEGRAGDLPSVPVTVPLNDSAKNVFVLNGISDPPSGRNIHMWGCLVASDIPLISGNIIQPFVSPTYFREAATRLRARYAVGVI